MEDLQSTSSEASAPDFRIPCVVVRPPVSSRSKYEAPESSFSMPRPGSGVQPLPRTTSVGDDGRGTSTLHSFEAHLFSSLGAGYSVAFSEASHGAFDSPRGVFGTSQRSTRDLGHANLDSASMSEASAVEHAGSSGGARTSADYKMLIAKADALLEQFAGQGSGLHS